MSKLSPKAHTPEFPFAKFSGVLSLGGKELDAYVLSNEERVLSMRGMVRAFTQIDQGIVGKIPGAKVVLPLAFKDFSVGNFPEFLIPGNPRPAHGITAEQFIRTPIQMTIYLPENFGR